MFLFSKVPANFQSDYGLQESAQRLATATERPTFYPRRHEAAVGIVRGENVSLQRIKPYWGNSFKPCFIGKFREENGRIVLTGNFIIRLFVKLFMTFWFGFLFIITVLTSVGEHPNQNMWLIPLACISIMAAGAAMVLLGKRLSKDDIPWLSEIIKTALSKRAI